VNKTRPRATLAVGATLALAASLIAAGSAQASTLPTLNVTVTSSSITVGGSPQSGGVNVLSTASGVKEASVLLFQLKPGVTAAELESALKSGTAKDPNGAGKYGSIVFDVGTAPGHVNESQTSLEPGNYVALGGPGEGPPTVFAPFTVTAAKSPATLPTPEATLRTIEFGFRGPATLHDGELVRFENEGFLVHMDVIFPVKSKNAAKRAVLDLKAGNQKALQKLIVGAPFGTGPVSHEAFQQETVTARPGWYVQACFMETQDGRDHTLLGMERAIRIVK
jgi:hypothetical protein